MIKTFLNTDTGALDRAVNDEMTSPKERLTKLANNQKEREEVGLVKEWSDHRDYGEIKGIDETLTWVRAELKKLIDRHKNVLRPDFLEEYEAFVQEKLA